MKIAINRCWGGFGLSKEALNKLSGTPCKHIIKNGNSPYCHSADKERTCPHLISVIEEIGCEAASDGLAEIKIVEIPDGISWHIHDYDGMERVEEDHASWS